MTGILSPEQIGQLSLLRAMVDPDAKEQLAQSVQKILAAAAEADTKLAELREQEATNRNLLIEAERHHAEAGAIMAAIASRTRDLDDRERAMAEVGDAMNAEKAAFAEVRDSVKAGHDARGKALLERESVLSAREERVGRLMVENTDRAAALDDREEKLSSAIGKLKAAMAELE